MVDVRRCFLPLLALLTDASRAEEAAPQAEDFWYQGVVAYARALEQAKKSEWLEAMELYQTAADRMAFVAQEFPDFQSDIVRFRLAALRDDAAKSYNEVCALDHHGADAYFGLMDQLAGGEREFSLGRWEASIRTLLSAHADLLDLRLGKPDFFPVTVRRQLLRCEEQLQKSEKALKTTPGGKALLARLHKELNELDLATLGLPENPEISMSPALFP